MAEQANARTPGDHFETVREVDGPRRVHRVAEFDDRRDQRRRAIAARTVAERRPKRQSGRIHVPVQAEEDAAVRVTLHLDEEDLARFRDALARAEERAACADPCDIIDGAKYALDHLPIATAPGYVRARIADVQRLIIMLEDEEWLLPPAFQAAVLRALAYFGDPEDLVPDEIGVIGLLDDAIVLDLLIRDLRGMLRAYAEFTTYRAGRTVEPDEPGTDARLRCSQELAACRKRLQARLRSPARRAIA